MQTYLLQAMLKQMELVRKKVLEKPGTLPTLMMQLQTGDTDSQIKAAEMLFCVVGQGPGRDVAATRQVSPDDHMPTALHDLVPNLLKSCSSTQFATVTPPIVACHGCAYWL